MKKTVAEAVVLLISLASLAVAGNWHTAGSLRCDDCHVQHQNPQDASGPYSYLLVKNSVNEVCLSCHDGSVADAPDVQSPVTMYSASVSQQSGGGFFGLLGIENANGHTLGFPLPTPLESSNQPRELNCASCHAVHGNGNYRNLLEDPAGVGANLRVEVGTDVMLNHLPDDPPTTAGSAAAYEKDNTAYVSGMSEWCSSCHDVLSQNGQASSPAHFNGHPSDIALNQFGPDAHTDPTHWVAGSGAGFPDAGATGLPRVPFSAPQATTYSSALAPSESNQVMCLSCHKAHGSNNKNGMLWPYLDGGPNDISGCQQCHNK